MSTAKENTRCCVALLQLAFYVSTLMLLAVATLRFPSAGLDSFIAGAVTGLSVTLAVAGFTEGVCARHGLEQCRAYSKRLRALGEFASISLSTYVGLAAAALPMAADFLFPAGLLLAASGLLAVTASRDWCDAVSASATVLAAVVGGCSDGAVSAAVLVAPWLMYALTTVV